MSKMKEQLGWFWISTLDLNIPSDTRACVPTGACIPTQIRILTYAYHIITHEKWKVGERIYLSPQFQNAASRDLENHSSLGMLVAAYCVQLFSLLFSPGLWPKGWHHPYSEWIFLLHLTHCNGHVHRFISCLVLNPDSINYYRVCALT